MSERMVERVKQALRKAGLDNPVWEEEALARAAIEAMREPTKAMRQAVHEIGGSQWVANLNAVWPTAIAATLSEDEGK